MVYGLTSIIHLFSGYLHKQKNKGPMDSEQFREYGKAMVDYIADYMQNIHKRRVVPNIEPGYLRDLLPQNAPEKGESFEQIMNDFEKFIMPGKFVIEITHWQHPRFHAYFPAGNSFPSILADMLSDALGTVGFSWAACPAITELDMQMLDWFGKMLGLPADFLPYTDNSEGGGVIQGSASECILVTMLAARFDTLKILKEKYPFVEEGVLMSKLIAYCSKEAHSSVEKAAMICATKIRILETDSRFRLRGETVKSAITEDRGIGLIPFFVTTTLGTTSCCSFDVLSEIGPVCTEQNVWLHVDAAYAGSAFICPEFKFYLSGIEVGNIDGKDIFDVQQFQHASSFNTNPNKWMLVNFDCSTMWVKDRFKLTQALVVDPLYLQHSWTDKAIDYRHWGIPLSRRFRSLKLWFVIRMYGIEGIQNYIREHVRLARKFESLVKSDSRFEVINDVIMGLVCFRLKGHNELSKRLLTKLNASGRIHMVPASLDKKFVIRFCVCAEQASDKDIVIAFEIIKQTANNVIDTEGHEATIEEDEEQEEEEESEEGDTQENATSSRPHRNSMDKKSLAYKRSFLVRMVSDPKCYNPKINRSTANNNTRRLSEDLKRDLSIRFDIATPNDVGHVTLAEGLNHNEDEAIGGKSL